MEESIWGPIRCGFIASSKEYLGYAETVIFRIDTAGLFGLHQDVIFRSN